MSLILIAGLAGYALSNPRRRSKRRRRNPKGLTAPQRAFLAYLAEAGSSVFYDDLRDKNKLLRFWPVYKSAKRCGYIINDVDGPILLTDVGRAALGKTNPRRRRNPLSLDALALPAANLLWRKHGYQSPGHAEDLAMVARRGTTAAKLWARVAQITKGWLYGGKKRSNPGGKPKKVHFNDSTKIPPELLNQLQTVKPFHESDDQSNWYIVWDGWEWKATGCSTIATHDKPNLCDLTLEPMWEHTPKSGKKRSNPRKRRGKR